MADTPTIEEAPINLFLLRFSHTHQSFRVPEIEALAVVEGIDMQIVEYSPESPFCIVRLSDPSRAAALIRRSILTQSISELWASAHSLAALHASLRTTTSHLWPRYAHCAWKFRIDSFRATRPHRTLPALIDSFSYLSFQGPIALRDPDETFSLFEAWPDPSARAGERRGADGQTAPALPAEPERVFFGRLVGAGARELAATYDLKKRRYIATTSMDAELALVTANIALAAPGKLFYDPFVGTGSFPVACAHFGALALGSDIDGRTIRGKSASEEKTRERGPPRRSPSDTGPGSGTCIRHNFEQYGLMDRLGPMFAADLTNSPIRVANTTTRLLDGIVCDPPYGVREGLRVLGHRDADKAPWVLETAARLHNDPSYIPSKKPYSFHAMLDDILMFAARTLVDDARLSFWLPTANDEGREVPLPQHPCLEIVSVCTQPFSKWSRRLVTYRRLPDSQVDQAKLAAYMPHQDTAGGTTADELNPFRKGYFSKFASS